MLLWVAFFNGYPVFYPDSGQYLWVSFDLQPPIYRTISYSIFIRLVSFGTSPWLVVIAQSLIVIFVLRSVFNFIVRQNAPSERGGLVFLGLMVFLAFGTTLPWFVGQVCLANCYFPSYRACNNVSCFSCLTSRLSASNCMLLILKAPRVR
jgi:hypothetical protein